MEEPVRSTHAMLIMHGQAQLILFWSTRACHQTFFFNEGAVLVPYNVILFYVIVEMFFH